MRRAQIPNLLTGLRLLCVPAAFAVMIWGPVLSPILFWLFLVACATDFLDGYLARRWNAVTPLGALLDPIADKLLVVLMLIYLVDLGGDAQATSTLTNPLFVPVILIVLRELYISGLREFLAKRRVTLPVSKGGKLKTTFQMLGLLLMLSPPILHSFEPLTYGIITLWCAAALAVGTAVHYTVVSVRALKTA